MKKYLCLFLLLAVLLTGCGPAEPVTEPTTEPATEPTTELTTEPTTDPTTDTTVPTESEEPLPEEPLPPTVGDNAHSGVHVDFSVYTPGDNTLGPPLYALPEGEADQLPFSEPRSLYPYAGSAVRNDYGYVEDYLYGLADSTGTLITQPVYVYIYPLRNYETRTTLPFWILEQVEKETHAWDDGTTFDTARRKKGLVAMDGTFMLDCIYDQIQLYGDRILCGRDSDTTGGAPLLEAYDANGNLRFSSADYSFGASLADCYGSYGEGLYVLSILDNGPDAEEYDSSYYFVTEDGQILYGPYRNALPFHENLAMVSLGMNEDTYLRRDGTLFPETYYYANSFQNGFAMITVENWKNGLIDTNGNMYIAPAGSITYIEEGAYLVWSQPGDNYFPTRCYDEYGNFLWELEEQWSNVLTRDLLYYSTDTNTIIKSISTGKELTLPVSYYVEYQSHPTDPYLIAYDYTSHGGTYTHYILTMDLEIFAEVKSPWAALQEPVSRIADDNSGFALRNGEQVTLYHSPKNPVGTYTVPIFEAATLFPDGTVSFVRENHTEIYDKDGNLFFRYSFDAMDD